MKIKNLSNKQLRQLIHLAESKLKESSLTLAIERFKKDLSDDMESLKAQSKHILNRYGKWENTTAPEMTNNSHIQADIAELRTKLKEVVALVNKIEREKS